MLQKNIKSLFKGGNAVVSNMNKILYNRFVLYFIFALSLFQIFQFVSTGNYMFVTVFVLIGFITSFFSKNMLVILCIALVATNILKHGSRAGMEGLESKGENEEKEGKEEKEEKEGKENMEDKKEGKENMEDKKKSSAPVSKNNVEEDKKENPYEKSDKLMGMAEKYKELMNLQNKIVDNMKSIEEPLSAAEKLVESMKGHLND